MGDESSFEIPPWLNGPIELMNHALEHMACGSDLDRRMALIGFDNAIEVCIDVYLNLPKEVRDDIEVSKEDVSKTRNNFYEKVNFLKRLFLEKKIPERLPFKEIIWFHNLRNEMYHSGNGVAPELYVLEGAKASSILVYKALFNVDILKFCGKSSLQQTLGENQKIIEEQQKALEAFQSYLENHIQQFNEWFTPKEIKTTIRETLRNKGYIQVWLTNYQIKRKGIEGTYKVCKLICHMENGRFGEQSFIKVRKNWVEMDVRLTHYLTLKELESAYRENGYELNINPNFTTIEGITPGGE